jgi:Chaperone of endosialidase
MITTINLTNPTPRSPARSALLLTAAILVCFALPVVPKVFEVSPPPDGGYAGANTAEGDNALFSLTSGVNNTADGANARFSNTSGNNNTATGFAALESNTTGGENTAVGFEALFRNTTGNFNTAAGGGALLNNTTGSDNTATGINALANNTTGPSNTATGVGALVSNTTGSNNTAEGVSALNRNTTGSFNIALGNSAGINLTKGNNNIDIGNAGLAGESAKIRIGTKGTQKQTFIAGISGVTVAGGVGVVNSNGQLGTVTSSARFKEQIKPMEKASEAILKLEPVSFRYKHDLDPAGIPQFGLVAEQVEKVAPELVARDEQGKAYTCATKQ